MRLPVGRRGVGRRRRPEVAAPRERPASGKLTVQG
jgi:hypothetical protein